MPYICGRPQRICGVDYKPGDTVPLDAVSEVRQNALANMLTRGVLRYVEGGEQHTPAEPVYKGSGWWEWPNGMKARGKADKPPVLTGVN